MHKNKIWLGFLTLMTLVVAWFLWGTVDKLRDYVQYSNFTAPSDIDWTIQMANEETYYLKGTFKYHFQNKQYNGETIIYQFPYQNPWAAEQAIPQQIAKNWKVWYDPGNPHKSTLVKKFPTKDLISTAILIGLWIYFIWLGFYVARYHRSTR